MTLEELLSQKKYGELYVYVKGSLEIFVDREEKWFSEVLPIGELGFCPGIADSLYESTGHTYPDIWSMQL